MTMVRIGIVGGTGYTGAELLRLLLRHPGVELIAVTSRQESGKRIDGLLPQFRGHTELSFAAPDVDRLAVCDAVFFATPHGAAMQLAPQLVARGVRVLDLSADFRLRNPDEYKRWYGAEHAAPALLEEAVYGLPELNREQLPDARLVACPGCYPTSVQLGFAPLLEQGLVDGMRLIADCKSGVSGAGRELKLGSLYGEAADNFRAYGVAGHRHLPEITQGLRAMAGGDVQLTFVPHLTPMLRGIHATLYAPLLRRDVDLQRAFEQRYANEPFVDVLPAGTLPETRSVRGINHCRIAVHQPEGGSTAVVLVVIDNLVKGAAGQAVQCMNLMFGLPETTGLEQPALWP